MKFLGSQLTYLLTQRETRRNLQALLKYLAFLVAVILAYSVAFHWIMQEVEGRAHSWITGIYWTLTVMSTLGFGDITFESDVGRAFSVLVLLSGIILLLIVLPFAFIRFFYAPWLEAQIRLRAPRRVEPGTTGHVIACRYDPIVRGLVRRLSPLGVTSYVLEPDPTRAAGLHGEGVTVINGEIDPLATYEALQTEGALAVLANLDDATNTNVTLTVRERFPDVPLIAVAEEEESVDLLELAGATHVVPLKRLLGEHLASRVDAVHPQCHVVGSFKDLRIAEFPIHKTPFVGKAIRDTRLRETVGVNVVAVWARGRLLPAHPDLVLSDSTVAVVVGTAEQILELDTFLVIYDSNENPVLVLGGGKVGTAAAAALRRRGVAVHLVEKNPGVARRCTAAADQVVVGDAADRAVLEEAGLAAAPSVIITTHDDAINIYLTVYCRRLNPELRIVSRVEHERNIEAMHRAGADFALSYASLGIESVFALVRGRELVFLGEGVEFFVVDVPRSLAGRTLAEAQLGSRSGLNVIGVEHGDGAIGTIGPHTPLPADGKILTLGSVEQGERFRELYP